LHDLETARQRAAYPHQGELGEHEVRRRRTDVDPDARQVKRLLALDEAQPVDALVLRGHLVLVLGIVELVGVPHAAVVVHTTSMPC
jgi:hypothetical protein